MKKYMYAGPVVIFGRCVMNQWKATTYASSEDKARSNMAHQYKKKYHLLPTAKISLPGKIITE